MWYSAPGVPPMGIFFGRSRPWVMDSASQFRPAPPLAFDSPEFHAALDEVRRVARALTPVQVKLARRWSAADPWAVWNETAANALLRHRVPAADAARVLAVMNVAASDALVACFEAKYHYWTIRPSQVDSAIAIPDSVGLPNFPAFPSGHACSAGAFDAVLGHYLPQERAEFTRIAEEQAMARLYGGVHYRHDNEAGLALGRAVARFVIERERRSGSSVWRVAKGPR
jgi:membrane-associated phospholipid phosphatase